jgi:trimethylamine--corrinoid protein Co-methyltransferase
LERGVLREIIQTHAPGRFVQYARNPANNVTIGDDYTVFAPAYGPPHVHDLEQGRRLSTLKDLENFIKLTCLSPAIQHAGGLLCVPNDLPDSTSHLDLIYTHIRYSDKPFMGAVGNPQRAADTLAMGRLVFGVDFFDSHCCTLNLFNINSPLVFQGPVLGALKLYARHHQAILVTSYLMAGMTGPVTMAGCLALMLAEAQAGLALAQLIRPGVPVVFGAFGSPFSMRSMVPGFGAMESRMMLFAAAALARRLGVPCRGDAGIPSAKPVDAQAGFESGSATQAACLAGAHFILHGAGWLENGRVMSYEKFIMDARYLAYMRDLLEARAFDEPAVPATDGERDSLTRAHAEWRRMLQRYQPPVIDPGLDETLREFISHKKREIEKGS